MPVPRITYRDYLQLPEGGRWEVLEGDLRMVPAPGEFHQRVVSALNDTLKAFVKQHGLGRVYFAPFDVILAEDSVVQPDLLLITRDRLSILAPEGVRGAPDLVIEVLSHGSTAARDRGIKRQLYGRYGVREYWIVDPDSRTLELTVLQSGELQTWRVFRSGDRVESPLLPGFVLVLDELFTESP